MMMRGQRIADVYGDKAQKVGVATVCGYAIFAGYVGGQLLCQALAGGG